MTEPSPDPPSLPFASVLRTVSLVFIAITVAVSVGALVGFFAHIDSLRRIVSGQAPLRPNVAICLLLASASLIAYDRSSPRPWLRRAGALFAVLVIVVGAAALVEYALGVRLGIDRLLFGHRAAVPRASGRPSANTAVGLVLIAAALLAWDVRIGRLWVTHLLAWVSAAIGLLALTGLATGAQALISLSARQQVSLGAAACIMLLSFAILLARPERGEMALLASDGQGGIVLRRLLPLAIAVPALRVTVSLAGQRIGLLSSDQAQWLSAVVGTIALVILAYLAATASERADRVRRRAERTAGRLAAIVESCPDAIIWLAPDGTIESWNAAAEQLYGYTSEEAIGRPIAILTQPDDADGAHRLGAAVLGHTVRFETAHVRRNGTQVAVDVTLSPIRNRDGAIVGVSCLAQDCSERRRVDQELARLADAADYGADAVISIDLEGRICNWNRGAERLYGFSAHEAVGHDFRELTMLADEPSVNTSEVLAGAPAHQYEVGRRRKDGAIIDVLATVIPWRVDGELIGVTGIGIDITERKRSERELSRLAAIVEASDDAIFRVTADGIIQSWNPAAQRLYGYTPEEAIGRPSGMLGGPGWAPGTLHRAVAGGTVRIDSQGRRRDGSIVEIASSASPIRNGDAIVGAACVVRDMTEARRAERELQRLAQITEHGSDAIVSFDTDLVIRHWNPGAERLYGFAADEVIGLTHDELSGLAGEPEETTAECREAIARLLAGEDGYRFEVERRRKDGATFNAQVTLTTWSVGGRQFGLTMSATDITERARAEQAAGRLAAIVESSDAAIIGTTLDGEITSWNASAERMYGYTAAEAVGRHVSLVVPAERGDQLHRLLFSVSQGERVSHVETLRRRKDGRLLDVSVTESPIRDGRDRIIGASAIEHEITDRKAAERARERAVADLEEAQRIARVGSWSWDPRTDEATWSTQLYKIFGRDPAKGPATGADLLSYARSEDRDEVAAWYGAALGGGSDFELDYRIIGDDGVRRYIHAVGHEDPARAGCYVGTVQDVTELRAAEHRERSAEERFRHAFDDAAIGMALITSDGTVERANMALGLICGQTGKDLQGARLSDLLHPADRDTAAEALKALASGAIEELDLEWRLIPGAGAPLDISVNGTRLRSGAGPSPRLLCQFQDITQRKRFEEQLQFMADHDPLTGLLNRRRFEAELDRHVAHVRRYGPEGALLMLDIDNFKSVNDTLGHNAGDELLVAFAGVLRQRVRTSDLLARPGGDEFAILLPKADQAEATEVVRALIAATRDSTMLLGGERRKFTISIGVAMFGAGPDEPTGEASLIEADLALYEAKDAGRDGYAFYANSEYRSSRTKARLNWIDRIEHALQNDRLMLYAQPILDLHTDEVHQYEVLLRMLDDNDDSIPPAAFLHVAERYGLIAKLDAWVVGQAVQVLEQRPDLRLEVNVSGKSLGDRGLLDAIDRHLRSGRIDPGRLIFEVAETAAVANVTNAQSFAQHLRDRGCRFALDDFGAGFGSFYYLKHLPFDYVKIDGEFVQHAITGHIDQLVIEAVVRIAQGLGKETIAEFVTDERTKRMVKRLGVDYAQGYHTGKPVPVLDILSGCAPAPDPK